jgi:hypothetical protein
MDVMDYLALRQLTAPGEGSTVAQITAETGKPEQLVRTVLREAEQRDWAERAPDGGWRLP